MPFEEEYADWATIRKGQEHVSKNVNNVYLVTLCNTGEEKLIHPTKKHTVSIMLANTILNTLYGWDKPCCGPVYKEVKKSNGYIEITFYHNEGLTFDGENAKDIFV